MLSCCKRRTSSKSDHVNILLAIPYLLLPIFVIQQNGEEIQILESRIYWERIRNHESGGDCVSADAAEMGCMLMRRREEGGYMNIWTPLTGELRLRNGRSVANSN